MATKIENTITAVEAAVLAVYARTNYDNGVTSCTVAASWTTTAGNVSAITFTEADSSDTRTLTFNADELIGRHLLQGGVARRITDNGATASGVTALTTSAWTTAPTNAAGEIRDGFFKCPDDMLLLDCAEDRRYQMIVAPAARVAGHGIKATGRFEVEFEVQVYYEYTDDRRRDTLRASEDAQSIVNALLEDGNQPSGGVTLFERAAPHSEDVEVEEGDPPGFVLTIPMLATYTASSVES